MLGDGRLPRLAAVRRVCTVVSVFVVLSVLVVSSAVASTSRAKSKSGRRAPALALPSVKQCVSHRALTIQVLKVSGVTVLGVTVKVDGRLFKNFKRFQVQRFLTLSGLPKGTFALSATASATDGRTVTVTRTYRACATKPPASAPKLSVAVVGTGRGTVTGSSISCPGKCAASYPAGRKVTLTATPDSGSRFAGWSGGGCGGTGMCTVTMSSNRTITATFTTSSPPSLTLNVTFAGTGVGTVSGSGINCSSACSQSYPTGTVVTLTAAPGSGSSFSGWSGGGCSGTGTCTVTMSSVESISATFTINPSSLPPAGSYGGTTSQGYNIALYVSPDSTKLQDVTINAVELGCTPGGSYQDQSFNIPSIAIASDGSFTTTVVESGVIDNSAATITYTLSGHFQGTSISGQVSDDIAYNNGTAYSCTSNNQSWSATYSAQGTSQSALPPPAGSYGGTTSQGYNIALYVSPDSTKLEDVTINAVELGCTPGGSYQDQSFNIPSIAIASDGSFTTTVVESGVIDNSAATITYTLSGHFHGTTGGGLERVAGQVRDDIAYNNGTAYSCTSNNQSWSATYSAQGTSQSALPPPAGSYGGTTSQGYNIALYVSPDSTKLQDVTINAVELGCTPGGSYQDQSFNIPSIAIASDGSFTTTVVESGVIDNSAATITYTLSGHFHGTTGGGLERVAGQVRDDITYNNGTAYSCTSNNQSWSATYSAQGTSQSASPPPAGSYGGTTSQGYNTTFAVSSGGTQLQDVTINAVELGCTPGGNYQDQSFNIPSIAIASDGSFTTTVVRTGTVNSAPATITYTLSGHFHGTTGGGLERVAGQVRDDITYNNGTAYSCTSNNQSWSATS